MLRTTAEQQIAGVVRTLTISREAVRRYWLPRGLVWGVLLLGAVMWSLAIGQIDVRAINDIGLVSQAPPIMIISLAVLASGFALSLRLQPFSVGTTLAAVLLLAGAVHGLPSLVEDAPRFQTAYLHAGFTAAIAENGEFFTRVDARFNWPLFFSLGALVTQLAGIPNAIAMQPWAPVVSQLLYLPPLLYIFRSLTSDSRYVWTAIAFFYGANWIGQDYYSPQGFNILLYLTVLAILLRWFKRTSTPGWLSAVVHWIDLRLPWLRRPMYAVPPDPVPEAVPATARQRAGLVFILVIMAFVCVASHQLTPFALLGATAALVVLGRTQVTGLPVLVTVLIGLWISYMTVDFLAGHLEGLLAEVGSPHAAAEAGVAHRLSGSPGHVFVVQFRLIVTLAFWSLAALGAIRRFRHGYLDIEALALAAVPFGLILLQAYGGELVLRIYLFSLPFMAFLAAGAFLPTPRPMHMRTTEAVAVVVAVMFIALLVSKHGNERADIISADELAATDLLYDTAPPGSMIATVSTWGAVRYRDFADFRYHQVPLEFLGLDVPGLLAAIRHEAAPCSYLFITSSQEANVELNWGYTPAEWQQSKDVVLQSRSFRELYSNRDATILTTASAPSTCTAGWS
jgi:hypothetical protein